MNEEIKYSASINEIIYSVETRKPKRINAKGVYVSQGYTKRLVNNHPFADKRGYVAEHRLIMERHLNRFLKEKEFIHHIDQNRSNNQLSNLVLCYGQSEHNNLHKGKRNPNGRYVAIEEIFNELKFRLFNKNNRLTEVKTLSELMGKTFRRGQFSFRGRFTGLKDKQGKEIYEGDIIEFDKKEWGGNDNIHVVSWNNEDGSWSWGGGITSDMEYRKVIGNIYENPELL